VIQKNESTIFSVNGWAQWCEFNGSFRQNTYYPIGIHSWKTWMDAYRSFISNGNGYSSLSWTVNTHKWWHNSHNFWSKNSYKFRVTSFSFSKHGFYDGNKSYKIVAQLVFNCPLLPTLQNDLAEKQPITEKFLAMPLPPHLQVSQ